MVKKRGPGRPRGSKNKVVAQKTVEKVDPKDMLIAELSTKIHDLYVIIDYLEEKLEVK